MTHTQEGAMPPLTYFLMSLLLTLAFVVAVDLIATCLRRRARRTTHASEPQTTERRADGSTD
jgi:hypothetical protein